MVSFVSNRKVMSALELKVYDILKLRFSEQEATTVIEYMDEKVKNGVEEKVAQSKIIQTKDIEIFRTEIKEENAKIKVETNEGFSKLEVTIAQLRGEMKTGFSDVKVEILRWIFGIFMAMMLAILGLYLKK